MAALPTRAQTLPAYASGTWAAIAAAAAYFAVVYVGYPYRGVFAFDPDEGIQAGKALLLDRGYALYAQVWSDQPPLFTHLLRVWFGLFGWTMASGRTLVLAFGALLVFAVYDIVRLEAGHLAAAIAVTALAASAYVPRLSVSLMIGLPSVALALLAVWASFRWLHSGREGWLAVSGALLACSLATKLFTVFLLPVLAGWLLVFTSASTGRRWRPAGVWLFAFAAVGVALLLALVGTGQLDQLIVPHLAGRRAPGLQQFGAGGLVLTGLVEWPLTLLGAGAFVWLLRQRRDRLLIFPVWAVAAVVLLLTHAPVWYHHQLLLTAAYCPAIGVALAELARCRAAVLRAAALVALIALAGCAARRLLLSAPPEPAAAQGAAVEVISRHLGPARMVLATDPMYAFRAGAIVPPRLAVLSLKRVETDAHLDDEITASFAGAAPEEVVVTATAPSVVSEAIVRGMGDRYAPLFSQPGAAGVTVFVRRDLIGATTDHPLG